MYLIWFFPSGPSSLLSTVMTKMACDREERAFMSVTPTDRFLLPTLMTCWRESGLGANLDFLDALDHKGREILAVSDAGDDLWE
jgi:hypothetical protein